ncbi:SDR family oxidoreductase [Sphingobium sp. AS12]|uniref:SDR family NAD(P)-dependent oxidoreductase n=1 Tax=Sphingobium sp. AS12 TaxID=2849495 RepID=UPI001C311EEF|nr:SDR family oxidoreductase [Sphingobium sp. AS12]MBV2149112.1 SDR family oxidoreductase [Sphingobium sp. AS12]
MMGTNRLAGRHILVTGAGAGMGAAVARLFAAEGAALALLDINADALADVAEETGQLAIPCDVSSEQAVEDAVALSVRKLGGLDGLVNVAGVLINKPVAETSFADFQNLVGINLGGPFLTCRAALPHLHAAKAATIVNVASLSGLRSIPNMAVYTATKAGLVAFGEALSGELGPNVRLNTVCPGIIRTAMTDFMFENGHEAGEAMKKLIRLGRPGTPEEVAQACLYLTSDEASFVSGATLPVTGGHFR